jgi:hypothetical protein
VRGRIDCHIFRATGITAYSKTAAPSTAPKKLAGYASSKTTAPYDRRVDETSLQDVERIAT